MRCQGCNSIFDAYRIYAEHAYWCPKKAPGCEPVVETPGVPGYCSGCQTRFADVVEWFKHRPDCDAEQIPSYICDDVAADDPKKNLTDLLTTEGYRFLRDMRITCLPDCPAELAEQLREEMEAIVVDDGGKAIESCN